MRAERSSRARAVARATTLLLYSLMALAAATSVDTAAQSQAPATVRVDTGELQGVVDDGVVSFKGIPFAAPPVGEFRWRPPQPAAKWTGVRQAAEFGASCMQGRGFGPPPARRARRRACGPGTAPAPRRAPRPLPQRREPRPLRARNRAGTGSPGALRLRPPVRRRRKTVCT